MAGSGVVKCGHCRVNKMQPKRRGLCHGCYCTPGVRDLYPASDSKFARRGVLTGGYGLPEPTGELPQTEGKVAVLADRAAMGLALWHPKDARGDLS